MPYRALAFLALLATACSITTAPGGDPAEEGNGTAPAGPAVRCAFRAS